MTSMLSISPLNCFAHLAYIIRGPIIAIFTSFCQIVTQGLVAIFLGFFSTRSKPGFFLEKNKKKKKKIVTIVIVIQFVKLRKCKFIQLLNSSLRKSYLKLWEKNFKTVMEGKLRTYYKIKTSFGPFLIYM